MQLGLGPPGVRPEGPKDSSRPGVFEHGPLGPSTGADPTGPQLGIHGKARTMSLDATHLPALDAST
eukprot:112552-Pyramimonas_sp.AAC.1